MDANHVTDLLGAYALGCLEREEKAQVENHLAACPACQAELRAYQVVVEELPLAVPRRIPPPRLKQAVLARAAASHVPNRPIGLVEQLRNLLRSIQPAWAVVSLVLILGLAVSNFLLWQQVQQRAAPQMASFSAVSLKSPETSGTATAVLVISDEGKFGTLVTDGLEQLENGKQYQLWLIKDGKRTSGGVFSVNPDGYGALVVNTDVPLSSYESFGVTIEPAGGSPGPTGLKVLGSTK